MEGQDQPAGKGEAGDFAMVNGKKVKFGTVVKGKDGKPDMVLTREGWQPVKQPDDNLMGRMLNQTFGGGQRWD